MALAAATGMVQELGPSLAAVHEQVAVVTHAQLSLLKQIDNTMAALQRVEKIDQGLGAMEVYAMRLEHAKRRLGWLASIVSNIEVRVQAILDRVTSGPPKALLRGTSGAIGSGVVVVAAAAAAAAAASGAGAGGTAGATSSASGAGSGGGDIATSGTAADDSDVAADSSPTTDEAGGDAVGDAGGEAGGEDSGADTQSS